MSKHNYKNKQQSHGFNNSMAAHGTQSAYEVGGRSGAQDMLEHDAPSNQEIEVLAYRIHEEKGGADLDNWLEAERLLKEKHS